MIEEKKQEEKNNTNGVLLNRNSTNLTAQTLIFARHYQICEKIIYLF